MTCFVVDCGAVLHPASEGIDTAAEDELLPPTLFHSETVSALHESVHRGDLPRTVALDRRRAWDVAAQLGRPSTHAEYVAPTQLQAEALVTLEAPPARRIERLVGTAPLEALQGGW